MSLRQFERLVRVKSEMLKEHEEAEWMRTAVSVAYMMNMVGGAAGGKKWKQVQPQKLFNQWLGKNKPKGSFKERWARAMNRHHARLEREKKKAL